MSACSPIFHEPQAFSDDAADMMVAALEAQINPEEKDKLVSQIENPPQPVPLKEISQASKGAQKSEEKQTSLLAGVLKSAMSSPELVIADFNSGDKPNNLGGDFGGWDKDPNDDTQGCKATLVSDDASGDMEGFALRLDYDVDSPSPAYNGFWMKLENVNATPYDTLSFYVRGASKRFTKRMKVEFKTPDKRSASFFISGISADWQKIEIPLKRFKGIKNWGSVTELILVFDDVNTAPKKGTLLVDQITLERKEQGMPQGVVTQEPEEESKEELVQQKADA